MNSTTQIAPVEDLGFLDYCADGLDFGDAEDRAIFRGRVSDKVRLTTVEAMRGWVAGAMRDRHSAARAVADLYMANSVEVSPGVHSFTTKAGSQS